jgi:hypothetical protein
VLKSDFLFAVFLSMGFGFGFSCLLEGMIREWIS